MTLKVNEIRMVAVADVKLDPSNPNVMTKTEMDGLRESFNQFGYLDPIVLDENYLVADGEHRLTIYREFGEKEIPAYVLKLTDVERRLLRQAKNKLRGTHDKKKDADEMKILMDASRLDDLSILTASDTTDFLRLVEEYHDLPSLSEDEPLTRVDQSIVKPGQIWTLGRHRLMCSDSTRLDMVERLVPGSVDVILTDPPYNIDFSYNSYADDKTTEEYSTFTKTWFDVAMKKSTRLIVTPGPQNYKLWLNIQQPCDIAIWIKPGSQGQTPLFHFGCTEPIFFYGVFDGLRGDRDYLEFPSIKQPSMEVLHQILPDPEKYAPAKPIKLIGALLSLFSHSDASVLDFFGGYGTTLIACEQLNRRCYMMELDPSYCDVIIKRWENTTGQKAKLEET